MADGVAVPGELVGVLLAFVSALAFATTNTLFRRAVEPRDTVAAMVLTTAVNVTVLSCLVTAIALRQDPFPWSATGVGWFVVSGFLGPLTGRFSLMSGIARVGAGPSAAVKNMAPIVTVVFALVVLGEIPSAVATAGMVLSCVGLSLLLAFELSRFRHHLAAPGLLDAGSQAATSGTEASAAEMRRTTRARRIGFTFSVAAAVGFGVSQGIRKLGMEAMPNPVVGALIGASTALLAAVVIARTRGGLHATLTLQRRGALPWVVAAGLSSTLGQVTFFSALGYLDVSRVAVVAASEIILTLLLVALLLRRLETVRVGVMLSAVLIVAGVVSVSLG